MISVRVAFHEEEEGQGLLSEKVTSHITLLITTTPHKHTCYSQVFLCHFIAVVIESSVSFLKFVQVLEEKKSSSNSGSYIASMSIEDAAEGGWRASHEGIDQ